MENLNKMVKNTVNIDIIKKIKYETYMRYDIRKSTEFFSALVRSHLSKTPSLSSNASKMYKKSCQLYVCMLIRFANK